MVADLQKKEEKNEKDYDFFVNTLNFFQYVLF